MAYYENQNGLSNALVPVQTLEQITCGKVCRTNSTSLTSQVTAFHKSGRERKRKGLNFLLSGHI